MTDAQRIWDDEERELLLAGRGEAPPAGSEAGVFAALGLDGPVGPGGGGEEAPVSGLSPVPAPVAAGEGAAAGIFARPLTWIGVGGVLLALVPAGMLLGGGSPAETAGAPAPQLEEEQEIVALPAPSPVEVAENVPAPGADKTTVRDAAVDPQPAAQGAAAKAAPPVVTKAAPVARPSLAEELAIIKKARSSMNTGNLGAAEAALATHRQKFNPPRLASEARVLRVEILVKRGQMSQARKLAAPLMQKDSPYRARMETLLSTP